MHTEKDNSDFEGRWQKRPSRAKYPHAKEIFLLFPNQQITWQKYRNLCIAAENLYLTRGIQDCKDALDYYHKHKNEPFIPSIHNPQDLDMKWDKLVTYSLKK